MIKTTSDYKSYLEADRIALGRSHKYGFMDWLMDDIWTFERLLRRLEWQINCKASKGWDRVIRKLVWWIFLRKGRQCGFTIYPNTFGPGLSIAHAGTIVVHPNVQVGANCRLHACVNIGEGKDGKCPVLGGGVYIGPGAKLFGGIIIGDNTKIGANAVVHKSFPEGNCTLVGVPAKKVIKG